MKRVFFILFFFKKKDDNDFQQFYNAQLDTYSKETEQEQKEKEEQHNVDPSELADNMTVNLR